MKKYIQKILPNFIIDFIRGIRSARYREEINQIKILDNIKSDIKNIGHTNRLNILSELCEKYGSDKGFIDISGNNRPYNWHPHTYANYYHSIFSLNRENVKFVFECGIGTNNPNLNSNMTKKGIPGASLRVWRDYFFNAQIYGADIDKEILFEEERIKTFYVDQLNSNSIKSMWENIKVEEFDIIIEDSLHQPDASYNFFINSFHKLKKNGVFVIEDIRNDEIFYLQNKLKNYEVEVIVGSTQSKKVFYSNNLIIVRKN